MNATPLLIVGSARRDSHTAQFAHTVLAGVEHEVLNLLDFRLYPYDYAGQYSADDAFAEVVARLLAHDCLIFATPVYWYAMSGTMKLFLDRFTDLTAAHKAAGRQLRGKRTFLLSVGSDAALPPGFAVPFELTSRYFGMELQSTLYFSRKHPPTAAALREQISVFTQKLRLPRP